MLETPTSPDLKTVTCPNCGKPTIISIAGLWNECTECRVEIRKNLKTGIIEKNLDQEIPGGDG